MKVKCISSFYILNKGVFDIGEIIDLEKDFAEKLIKENKVIKYIEDIKEEKINYDELTIKELKEILKSKDLSTKGNKSELIKRLEEN